MISRKDQNKSKVNISQKIGWYLSGFVDGEGSFNVSLRKKADYKVGWQPVLSFNVSQREKTIQGDSRFDGRKETLKARRL